MTVSPRGAAAASAAARVPAVMVVPVSVVPVTVSVDPPSSSGWVDIFAQADRVRASGPGHAPSGRATNGWLAVARRTSTPGNGGRIADFCHIRKRFLPELTDWQWN